MLSTIKRSHIMKMVICVVLALLADFLYFEEPALWTLGIYAGAVSVFLFFYGAHHTPLRLCILLLTLVQASLLTYRFNMSSLLFVLLGIILLSLPSINSPLRSIENIIKLIRFSTVRPFLGISMVKRHMSNLKKIEHVPLIILFASCFALFIFIFTSANPVLTQWLSVFKLDNIFSTTTLFRIIFWTLTGTCAFILLKPRLSKNVDFSTMGKNNKILNELQNKSKRVETIVTWALCLFNLIFGLQLALDSIFLSSSATLPEGMTYAEYAQQGAYLLMVSAMLMIVIVVIIMDADNSRRSKKVNNLLFLWIGQTLVLVLFAILRLHHYIDAYGLTLLRIDAFVWMIITALSLINLSLCLYQQRNRLWLFNSNIIIIALSFYCYSFVNTNSIISHHNIRENCHNDSGYSLDLGYFNRMGASAIPALDWYVNNGHTQCFNFDTRIPQYLERLLNKTTINNKTWRHKSPHEILLLKQYAK